MFIYKIYRILNLSIRYCFVSLFCLYISVDQLQSTSLSDQCIDSCVGYMSPKLGGSKPATTITISKAKNSGLPLLIASLLHNGVTQLHVGNSIHLLDMHAVMNIISHLGGKVFCENGTITIDAREVQPIFVPDTLSSKTRYSILLLGVLTARFGYAHVGMPGGCNLNRPIDFHIKVFKELGCIVTENKSSLSVKKVSTSTNVIRLPYPSVGTTLNAILASLDLRNKRIITITNCAIEPEIDDVIVFLKKMGWRIKRNHRSIKISGVYKSTKKLIITHTPIQDRIEAGTYMLAAALLRIPITIVDAPIQDMHAVLALLNSIGCMVRIKGNTICIHGETIKDKSSIHLSTSPYPGFPTDLQPILAVLCTTFSKPSYLVDPEEFIKTIFVRNKNY